VSELPPYDDGIPGDDPDDVEFENVDIHIERMDTGHIWMGIYRKDGTSVRCGFYTPRNGRLLWSMEDDK
jgi:hypothetical protein